MGNLFSTSSTSKKKKKSGASGEITEVDKAILSLKIQRRKLEDQGKLIEKRIEHNMVVARELLLAKKKDRALLALKKKKLSENQLQSINQWVLNLENTLATIEMTKQQHALFDALKSGNDVLKQLQKEVTVEDVEKLMEDSAQAKAYQDEISAALSESLRPDEAEAAEAELEALEAAVVREEVTEKLPAVPTTKVPMAAGEKQPAAVPPQQQEVEEEVEEQQPQRERLLAS